MWEELMLLLRQNVLSKEKKGKKKSWHTSNSVNETWTGYNKIKYKEL